MRRPLPFVPRPFGSRPRLTASIATGLLTAAFLTLVPNPLSASSRAIVAWDVFCAAFIGIIGLMFFSVEEGRNSQIMRERAAMEDEGSGAILALTIVAVGASLGAVALELSLVKGRHDVLDSVRVALAFLTVGLSWVFVHLMFTLHYAREYYGPAEKPGDTRGGLSFPGKDQPDYWDFLHFAMVIGVASQTADIAFTSKTMRRIGTAHSLVSFGFNTVILALTINLLANLF